MASEQRFPDNSIPGWARYFWVDPARNLLVTLIPGGGVRNRNSGLPSARQYLQSFLHGFSPYAVTRILGSGPHFEDREVLGWRSDPSASPDPTLTARFETKPLSLPGPLDQIRYMQPEIRKLVTSCSVMRDVPGMRTGLEQAMQVLGWDRYRAPEGDKLNFRFETDWQPTKSELEGVIEAWERRNARALIGGAPVNDRVGVKTRGESGTKWFDRASCSDEMDLGQPLENSLHWTPQELTDIIQSVREPVAQLAAAAGGVS
jgi:hypothetical protein